MRLSILLATYNRRDLLRRCLDALARQTQSPSDFEVVVIVDGSMDGTVEMLEHYESPYRLRFRWRENGGKLQAINSGLDIPSGKVVLLLDDDIVASRHLVTEHLRVQDERGGAVVIGRLELELTPGADGLTHWFRRAWNRHYESLLNNPEGVTFRHCWGGNLSVPRDALVAVGGLPMVFPRGADVELGYLLSQRGLRVFFAPAAVAKHRLTKTFVDLATDAERAGTADVVLSRRHPETFVDDGLSRFSQTKRSIGLTRRMLLWADLAPNQLVFADPVIRRIPHANDIYAALYSYFQWRGVRHAVDEDEWAFLTSKHT